MRHSISGTFELAIGFIGIIVAGFGLRVDYSWNELRDTILASRFIAILESPEPPADTPPVDDSQHDQE